MRLPLLQTPLVLLLGLSAFLPPTTAAQPLSPRSGAPPTAGARSAIPDQEHLLLAIQLDAGARRVRGDAILRFASFEIEMDTLVLLATGLAIDSMQIGTLDSARVTASYHWGEADSVFVIPDTLLVPGAPFEVRLVYSAQPQQGLSFTDTASDGAAGGFEAWTDNMPGSARHWFPVTADPTDTHTSELLITVAPPLRALSNGRLVEQTINEDESVTFFYQQRQAHRADQLMIAVGAFAVMDETIRFTTGDRPVQVSYWYPPEEVGSLARSFGRVPAMMQFFVERLHAPYPGPTYTQVILRRFSEEGRATTGVASLPKHVLLDERALQDGDADALLARALARQWFEGLLTTRSWSDAWLQEGAATYLSALFTEHDRGADAFALALLQFADDYALETTAYHRPLVWEEGRTPYDVLDAHSRQKGAWVLHMLRRRLGDAAFWKVLEQFLATYPSKPVDTADFQHVVETIGRQGFDRFFEQWVYAAGHPILDVRYAYDADEGMLAVTATQRQSGERVPEVFNTELTVDAYTLTDTLRVNISLVERDQTFSVPLPGRPRFLVFDPDQDVLAILRVEQTARAWMGQLRYAREMISRLRAARALAAFVDDAALHVGLRGALREEPVAAVRQAIVQTLGQLPPSSATQRTLQDAFQEEDAQVRQAVLRALNAYVDAPEVQALAYQAAQQDPSYRVQATAVKTLAHTRNALAVVRSALITPSHRDVIRQAAIEALALLELPEQEALQLGLTHTRAVHPTEVRISATRYLRTRAAEAPPALDRLIELLTDHDLAVRRAAIESLGHVATDPARTALQQRRQDESHPLLLHILDRILRQSTPSDR